MRKNTPWGIADNVITLADGIISYSTPTHGGIWLSASRQKELTNMIGHVPNWLGTQEWWEEDCDWAVPYTCFASVIKDNKDVYNYESNLCTAKRIIINYYPKIATILAGRGGK